MPRPRLYKTEAVVLKGLPLGDADRILTLYTPEMGKLRVKARGVRRPRSRLAGHLDILTRVSLSLARGHTMDVVTGAEAVESHRALKEDLESTARGLYVSELVDAFAPEEAPHPPLYALLVDTLRVLDARGQTEMALRSFELRLLDLCGFLPELHRCVSCRQELTPGRHRYSPQDGGVLCDSCAGPGGAGFALSLEALKVLRFFARTTLGGAQQLRISPELGRELEAVLGAFIRHVLEREVRSAAFIEHLRRLREGSPVTPGASPS